MVLRSFLPLGIAAPIARLFFRRKGHTAASQSAAGDLVRQAAIRLLDAARVEPHQALQMFCSTAHGLTNQQVAHMRHKFGANSIAAKGKDSLPKRLFASFINPFSVVLLLLAGISFFTDYLLASADEKDLTAVIIVAVMVCISGVLHFVQEARSGNAVARLESLVKTTIEVVREGQGKELPIASLVVGDVVRLAAGDMIPADMRILRAKDLFVSQSSLTGESEPVEKFPHALQADVAATSPLECNNLAFMGSNVVSGAAYGLVLAVGGAPEFPDMLHEVARARELDQFASDHDAQLLFVLRARQAAWSPGYLLQNAARVGFVVGAMPGRLVLPASAPGLPPVLTLGYDTQAALADDPEQSAIRDISLSLDVAQVHRTEQPFARLREVGAALAEAMDGVLCDQNGQPLPAMAMDPIAADLELLYDQLDARDLSAGSVLARRLFS